MDSRAGQSLTQSVVVAGSSWETPSYQILDELTLLSFVFFLEGGVQVEKLVDLDSSSVPQRGHSQAGSGFSHGPLWLGPGGSRLWEMGERRLLHWTRLWRRTPKPGQGWGAQGCRNQIRERMSWWVGEGDRE